jgi:hypothetical protein
MAGILDTLKNTFSKSSGDNQAGTNPGSADMRPKGERVNNGILVAQGGNPNHPAGQRYPDQTYQATAAAPGIVSDLITQPAEYNPPQPAQGEITVDKVSGSKSVNMGVRTTTSGGYYQGNGTGNVNNANNVNNFNNVNGGYGGGYVPPGTSFQNTDTTIRYRGAEAKEHIEKPSPAVEKINERAKDEYDRGKLVELKGYIQSGQYIAASGLIRSGLPVPDSEKGVMLGGAMSIPDAQRRTETLKVLALPRGAGGGTPIYHGPNHPLTQNAVVQALYDGNTQVYTDFKNMGMRFDVDHQVRAITNAARSQNIPVLQFMKDNGFSFDAKDSRGHSARDYLERIDKKAAKLLDQLSSLQGMPSLQVTPEEPAVASGDMSFRQAVAGIGTVVSDMTSPDEVAVDPKAPHGKPAARMGGIKLS